MGGDAREGRAVCGRARSRAKPTAAEPPRPVFPVTPGPQLRWGLAVQRSLRGCWCHVPPPRKSTSSKSRAIFLRGITAEMSDPPGHANAGDASLLCRCHREMGSRQPVLNATGGSPEPPSSPETTSAPADPASAPNGRCSSQARDLRAPPEHSRLLTHRPRWALRQQPGGRAPAHPCAASGKRRGNELGYPQPLEPSRSPARSLLGTKGHGTNASGCRPASPRSLPGGEETGSVRCGVSQAGLTFFFWLSDLLFLVRSKGPKSHYS